MPLIFRVVKGTPLTFLEGDNNLRYLEGLTISSSANFSNWTGSSSSQFAGTASLALTASYALNAGTTVDTGSLVSTASFNAFTSSYNTGSFTGSFTGQLIGTASYVNLLAGPGIVINGLEITSSVRTVNGIFPTDGNIPISLSATVTGTSASLASSGSGNITGSIPDGLVWIISNDPTPSNNGDVYIYSSGSVGAWYQVAPLDQAASDARYIKLDGANTPMTGDLNMGGNNINNVGTMYGTASYATSASFAISASWAPSVPVDLGGYNTTASFNSFTSSYYQDSSSFDQRINSISFDTSSLLTTESFNAFTSSYNTGSFSGSFEGTSSWAESSSFALTASYALNVPAIDLSIYTLTASFDNFTSSYYQDSSSFDQRINSISFDSSSLLTTESFNNFTSSYNTGSFSGSFTGSFEGTASWANNAITASYILNAISASFASTASFVQIAQTASYVLNAVTASHLIGYSQDSASFNQRINSISFDTSSLPTPAITVNVATTTNLPGSPVYNNGVGGVGAFISSSVNSSIGTIDGITLFVGDRILVKNQATQLQNGVYEIVATGSASSRYLISRSLDSDETSELDSQIVIPSFGSTNAGGIFAQNTNNPVVGTNNIVYVRQTSTLVSQNTAGTQTIYQIPWWTGGARDLSRGSNHFRYINVTSGTTVTTSSLQLTGSFNLSGSAFVRGLTSASQTNVLTYNSSTGQIFFTASNAIGGGGSGLSGGTQYYVPVWTGATTLSTSSIYDDGSILKTISGSTDKGLYLDFANDNYALGDRTAINGNNFSIYIVNGNFQIENGYHGWTPYAIAGVESSTLFPSIVHSASPGNERIKTTLNGSNLGLNLDFVNAQYSLGDYNNTSGSTKLVIDDNARTVTVSGSMQLTGSLNISGSTNAAKIENGWVVLSQVSMSLDFANDTAAAAGGVPLGGLYRNGNAISIRIV